MTSFRFSMSSQAVRLFVLALALSLVGLHAAENDDEWRKRTGIDKRSGPEAATAKLEPKAVPGLVLWLDATRGVTAVAGGKVAAWADQCGSAQDLTQSDPTWQPQVLLAAINGLPAIRFLGSKDAAQAVLRDGFTLTATTGVSLIALVRQNSDSYSGNLLKFGPDNNLRGLNLSLNTFGAGLSPTSEYGSDLHSNGGPLTGTGFRLLTAVADGTAQVQELYEDGRRTARVDKHGAALEASGRLVVGGYRAGAGNCSVGVNADLAELLIFNRALTGAERAGLEQYLRIKWGLDKLNGAVTTLATSLPFAYYPSAGELELAFDTNAPVLREFLGKDYRPATQPGSVMPGLIWSTYGGDKPPEDWSKATVQKTGTVADLDLPPAAGFDEKLGTNAVFTVSARLEVPKDGTYTFVLRPMSGDMGLRIDDEEVSTTRWDSENWHGGAVALAAGWHRLQISGKGLYRRQPEHAALPLVLWSGPGFWRQPIPAARLGHVTNEPLIPAVKRVADPIKVPLPELARLSEAPFTVVEVRSGKVMSKGVLKLDVAGRGQGRFKVGDLPDGEYAIAYSLAGTFVGLPQTFTRARFPWEGNTLGKGHEVFPPFIPVAVDGATVTVVDRSYRLNAFGMLDSCVSKSRELLAAPMSVIAKVGGKELAWKPGRVTGKVLFPDTAEFTASATSDALSITARTTVEEDGCCRVEWTMTPGAKPAPIEWLELVIPLKEAETPLFGWSAQGSMRHHYWGLVPPKSEILWDTEPGKAPGWVPAAWSLGTGKPPADGEVWNSTRNLGSLSPFMCYIWLGAEERGLCWFADRPGQFVNDGKSPIQQVCRESGRVVLRVRIIQVPTLIDKPRTLSFGLQASPTKPLRSDWRSHQVPGGAGLPVVCWGGYQCSSKYPDNHDFSVVDQIMRVAKDPGLEEEVWAKLKELDGKRLWKDRKIFDSEDWYGNTLNYFLGQARNKSCCAYVEEHAHDVRMPEWQIFQDEWSGREFDRFQGGWGNYGVMAPSYHDFAVYYQNEYLRRGVSIYYDNSFPRQETNPFVLGGARDTAAGLWGLRDYYKRTWKNIQRLERDKISPLPLDFTIHLTNTMMLPMHTWATSSLDLEQPYRSGLPFPPDYTRAMTSGLHAGLIAHGMFPLANYNDYRLPATRQWTEEQALADWGMFQVHEVRSGNWQPWVNDWKQWKSFRDALVTVGYGQQQATVINYWKPAAPIAVTSGPEVCWIAVLPPADKPLPGVLGVVLLQSYAKDGTSATVTWQGAKAFIDQRTRQSVGEGASAKVDLPGSFGTRLLWVVTDPSVVPAP